VIKVNQKEVDPKTGDCMRASIASVLEAELEAVPHLTRTVQEKWFTVMYYFFISYGFKYSGMWWPTNGKRKLRKRDSIGGFYLASVYSRTYPRKRNITHLVVMDSNWNVAHDPHPNKKWQDESLLNNPDLESIYKFRTMNKTDKCYWHYLND
jgi:hypothetical protein